MTPKVELITPDKASALCLEIAKDNPEYFGIDEANKKYAEGVKSCKNYACFIDEKPVGLLSLASPYPGTADIYWLGLMKAYHQKGIGSHMLNGVLNKALSKDIQSVTVETLSPSVQNEPYLKTYSFYEKNGFRPMFDLKPEGHLHPMVYMVRFLGQATSEA